MQTTNRFALKEWAMVVKALAEGRQILILRKGGLIEKNRRFEVEHPGFFLYPTYLHQQRKGVTPDQLPMLDLLMKNPPPEGRLVLSDYAVVQEAAPITDLSVLKKLEGHHIFNAGEVEKRFHYGKRPGLNLLLLRVYRLPEPTTLPVLPHYAGCKSWVDLERELPTAGCRPVLSDSDFNREMAQIRAIIGETISGRPHHQRA